jgi:Glyoxalase-like domain
MPAQARFDHAVINTRFELQRAAGAFGRLGFQLTAQGRHSMGSINHLIMFATDYLELIGLPPGMDPPLAYIAEAPPGINGLVFKTADADADFAHLQALGMAGDAPRAFTRPVRLPAGEAPARFRTVQVRPGIFPGGRVYFCEHGTPELVWRPEWQSHPNGAAAIAEFVIASQQHQREAEQFAALLRAPVAPLPGGQGASVAVAGGRITLLAPAAYAQRYGKLASPLAGRTSLFGALVLRTPDLPALREALRAPGPGVALEEHGGRIVVRESAFDAVLEFSAAPGA